VRDKGPGSFVPLSRDCFVPGLKDPGRQPELEWPIQISF